MTKSANTERRKMDRFPYGAVYFRKSNPPREDWERDYETAAADGMNTFRHWFMWSAIEPEPGTYVWDDYDTHMDLAAANGITTVIAELTKTAPEWVFARLPHTRYIRRNGQPIESNMFDSSTTGGNPGVCLDNDDAREAAGRFLTALAERYKDHPGMGGWDIWNECNYEDDVCYCPATAARFRLWLQRKYDDIGNLRHAWGRHATSWDDIMPPRHGNAYGDVLDWLAFRRDNAYELMRWRIGIVRAIDTKNPVTAHGIAATFGFASARGADDWRAAEDVDAYGMTFVPARRGDAPWIQAFSLDLVRGASRGKPFWHAELQGGPLWLQPQVTGRSRDDGRIATPTDIRYWNMSSFAHGATGLMYLRWRPLLNGPLFGAFGPYAADGSRTDRSEMVSSLAKWATGSEQADLWESTPERGDIGIVYVPESQDFAYGLALSGTTGATIENQWLGAGPYSDAITGAWQGFFDAGARPDFVHIDDLDLYTTIYLPFPVLLPQTAIERIEAWVRAGGTLISEGAPGYFSDNGWMSPEQPRASFAGLFGANEAEVEFVPDLLVDTTLTTDEGSAYAGWVRQRFEPTTGTGAGDYSDGGIAVVDATHGEGRSRLIGTSPGIGYGKHRGGQADSSWFRAQLAWAGVTPAIEVDDADLISRLHVGDGGTHVWVLNPTREERTATVTLPGRAVASARTRWGADDAHTVAGERITVTVPPRDALVVTLEVQA